MPVPGPTDDEWKKMTPAQKRTYKIFGYVICAILLVLLSIKAFSR
jgi:hypothetical protein